MKLLILVLCVVHLSWCASGEASSIENGGCSRKCQPRSGQADDIRGNEGGSLLPFPCSCTSSCTLYRDCCYDSPYRHQEKKHDHPQTMCMSLSGRGQFRAVSDCPREWNESSRFCTGSIGHLSPVTSKTTGTTYANVYCAICHGEESIVQWNVELRCCPEHRFFGERRYTYSKGQMWSHVTGHNKCICRYHAHDDDFTFLQNLEVRTCDIHLEISKCSSSWISPSNSSEDVQQECSSFVDPVYIGEKIFRNRFCAQCNFKRMDSAKCMPAVVESMASGGLGADEIFRFCLENRLAECLYYITSSGRGNVRKFSELFDISEKSCLPPEGRRCCVGQRYDYRRKRCRRLVKEG